MPLERDPSCVECSEDEAGEERKICFLKKQDRLIDGLTVAENLFLKMEKGIFYSKKKREQICRQLFSLIGYELPVHAQVSELTVSQRRFVEFYRIYLLEPRILLAHEVTANLSYKEIVYFNQIIQKMKAKGTVVFYFTTRWEEAIKVGDIFHVYVDGVQKRIFTQSEVRLNPQEMYALLMDIDMNQVGTDEQREQQKWAKMIHSSLQIENQLARINAVLNAYCDRLKKLMNGQFCRLYLYQTSNQRLVCMGYSSDIHASYGRMGEDDILMVMHTSTLYMTNEKEPGYQELFENDHYPKGLICYTLKSKEGDWVFVEIGTDSKAKYINNNKLDMFYYIVLELLIFIENNRLRNQTVILQESSHRIKNNMQMILSYLMLQRQSLQQQLTQEEDREIADHAFQDLMDRIMTVYNVHNLISSEETLQDTVRFSDLLAEISHMYEDYIELELRLEEIVFIKKKMLSLCTIFNEMMNNTVKHNRVLNRKIHVKIKIWREDNDICIVYHDDGIGNTGCAKRESGDSIDRKKGSSGIGMRLIELTVQNELKGSLAIDAEHGGYKIWIRFPKEGMVRKK